MSITCSETRPIPDLLGEELEQREVLLDHLARVGPLHLHDDLLAVRERRTVHLRDRPGGERQRVDVVEDVLPRDAQLLLHHPDDLLLGERRHVVLQRGELLDELGREEVGTRGQDLAELAEGRTQLSSAARSALGLRCAADGALSSGRPKSSFSPCLAKTAAIFVPRADQAGLGLGLDVRSAEPLALAGSGRA